MTLFSFRSLCVDGFCPSEVGWTVVYVVVGVFDAIRCRWLHVRGRDLVFECSIRDFFEPQNNAEQCWFQALFTQFREVFE
jgi:hypothetical protein